MKALRLLLFLACATGCTNRLVDDVPRLYACDRSAGLDSCPGGWRCGLSGYCQDPAQPLPYACESSADCSAAWHCGPERICYDRAAARDRSCRLSLEALPDAGDCAPGWRCGTEVRGEVCHPLDAGAAYACTSDSDCEGGWRCGPQRLCVDVALQGLRVADVPFTTARVSPLLPGRVELLQVTFAPRLSGAPEVTNRVVFTAGGKLTRASNGHDAQGDPVSSREETPLLRSPHALAQTQQHLLVTDATGLVDYADAFDGGTASLVLPRLAGAELRYAPPLNRFGSIIAEELVAFSGPRVELCTGSSNEFSQCDPRSFQADTLPGDVQDLAFFDGYLGRRSILAATSRGPLFAPRSGSFLALDGGSSASPVWRPVSLAGLSDACSPSPTSLQRATFDPDREVLAVSSDQDQRVSFFKRSGPSFSGPCEALAFDREYGPCTACPQGETLLRLGVDGTLDHDGVLAFCGRPSADAGVSTAAYRHHSFDAGCSLEPVSLPASVRAGFHFSEATPTPAGLDSVGVPRECPLQGCETLLEAAAPDRTAGGPALLVTGFDDVLLPSGEHEAQPSAINGALGLQPYTGVNLFVAGSVIDRPDWLIGSLGIINTFGDQSLVIQSLSRRYSDLQAPVLPMAVLSRSNDLVPVQALGGQGLTGGSPAAFSTITTDAEGTPWVIIGAGDRIWAEDARLLGEDAGVRSIGIKVVPFPSADIQSLAFAAFDRRDAGAGPLLEGYTVEQQRLFRVVVQGPALWLSDEIRLGETSTVPVAVWMEGSRGRVGTSDGRVFGLPVPVAISTAIPEAPLPTVLNYGSLCGQGFALSPSALYQLSLETPPLGTWKRVSLESAQPGLDTLGPHWGATMHKARVGNEEHLYLFSQTGLVIDLRATCP